MWQLHHFPLCPFSRKVRLALAEKGIAFDLIHENAWDASDAFLQLNPTGRTPVLRDEGRGVTLMDSQAICEYLEETEEAGPLIHGNAASRAEIRRLTAMFDQVFYADVTAPLLQEKMRKRLVTGEPPSAQLLRGALRLAHEYLDYIDWLTDNRRWLAGARLSLADFAAAAQISVAIYLEGIDFAGHEGAHSWYRVIKSRPGFRPLLADRMAGIPAPRNYADVNS